MGIGHLGQQLRQRGLAHARRAPEDHRMQRALLQCFAQRFAAREQMLLPDVFVEAGGTQARG